MVLSDHCVSADDVVREMNIFEKRKVQVSIESCERVRYSPVQSLDNANSVRFHVPGVQNSYISTTHVELCLDLQLLKADGSKLAADVKVAPENAIQLCLFNGCDVTLNQQNVTPPTNMLHIINFLQVLASYGSMAKQGHLGTIGWYACKAGKFADATDAGFLKRQKLAAESNIFQVSGLIFHPLFQCAKAIPNKTEMQITLHRNRDSFCITDLTPAASGASSSTAAVQENYKIKIVQASLYVTRINPVQKRMIEDGIAFESGPARYFLPKIDAKTFTIPRGIVTKNFNSIIVGVLPKRVTIALFAADALQGNYKKSGLELKHFNLRNITLVAGNRRYPEIAYDLDFAKSHYTRAYTDLFHGLGLHAKNRDININLEEWGNGYTFFCFDLTQSHSASNMTYRDSDQDGDLSLELSFDEATTETISVVMCCENTSVMTIDKHRNVKIDEA
jgi:hypothetical protein